MQSGTAGIGDGEMCGSIVRVQTPHAWVRAFEMEKWEKPSPKKKKKKKKSGGKSWVI
jgi:hypothetical protein